MRFQEFPIQDATKRALEAMGFDEPTPVQAETIPLLLEGRDVIGQAQTGTGKTAAFGIPLIEAAYDGRRGLVLAPTRELAKQVQRELQAIGKGSPVDVVCLIGGAPMHDQVRALKRHPGALLVATPGRIIDHMERGNLTLDEIGLFVLDEADEMLSMGFQDELEAIVARLPEKRQTLLFTATLAPQVERLAKKALQDPATVRTGGGAVAELRQCYATVAQRRRAEAVARIIEAEDPQATLLFARTRARVDDLVETLRSLDAEGLHGGMGQAQRDAAMRRFRDGTTKLLVATDVAARGLDVDEVELVLHDDPAGDVDTYVHRIGRTARAGRKGTSIILLGPGKTRRLAPLKKIGELEHYEVPDAAGMAELRGKRLVEELQVAGGGKPAHATLKAALEAGLTLEQVAVRAIDALLGKEAEEAEAVTVEASQNAALALKVGAMDNVHPGSIVGVLTNAGGLQAEEIGRIDVLPRMSVVEVPAAKMDALCEDLGRVQLSRRDLKPRAAEDWQFKPKAAGRPGDGYKGKSGGGYKGKSDGGYKGEGGYKGKKVFDKKPYQKAGFKGKKNFGGKKDFKKKPSKTVWK